MNEALVAAQQLRQDTRAAAEREGQVIVREAQAEAKRLLDEAKNARARCRRVGGDRAAVPAVRRRLSRPLERQLAELRALDGQRG